MAKKGQAAQLQQEINSDEDWEKLLLKEGLIVVEIYSEWCGHCSSMIANLKKVKMEVGGDNLVLAIAKSDCISCLSRFKNKSEPTWMFIAGGKMVNLMFGADSPKLIGLIIEELKKEAAVKAGTRERAAIAISELSPEERVRYDAAKAIEDETTRIATEKRLRLLNERRTTVANVVLEHAHNFGVIVVFPQAKDTYKVNLADLWEPAALAIAGTEKPHFTEEMIEELLYFAEYQFNEIDIVNLLSEQTFAFLIKSTLGEDFTDDIDETVLEFVYGPSKCPPGDPESPAHTLIGFVPVPKEVKEEVAALENEESLKELNLALPSIPSLTALQVESSKNLRSKTEMRSQLEMFSKTVIHSRELVSKTSIREGEEEAAEGEIEETLEVTGLWAPPNSLTKATAIKLLFPKIYDPIAVPEPIPTPPHIAIAFDVLKRKEILNLMADYPDDIMRFGFFTQDNPETAKLIAKSVPKFERIRATGQTQGGEKLVIQLSKKRSEAWCAFSQLSPSFMSHTPADGEEDCKLFFPENYDEPETEEEVVVVEVKKKKKKGKKTKEAESEQEAAGEQEEGEGEPDRQGEEEEGEEEGMDEEEEGDTEGDITTSEPITGEDSFPIEEEG